MASATVGALRVTLSADSSQFSKGLKDAEGGLSKFGMAAKAGVAAVAAIGVAAAAAAAAVVAGVRRTIAEADKMAKAAQSIGIPVEELQKLKHAADLSGVSFESLQTSVARLSRAMAEAAAGGGGAAAKAFEEIGVAVTNADGSLRTSSEVMSDVAEKFSQMDDGAQKTALAMQIFGRAGASMIPMLNQGREALEASKREAEQFGAVMSGPLTQASERFNDNLSRMGTWFQGIYVQIAERVVPILADLTDKIVTWAKESDTAHRIGAFLDRMFIGIAESAAVVRSYVDRTTSALMFLGKTAQEVVRIAKGEGELGKIAEFWRAMQEEISDSANKLAADLERIRNPGAPAVTIPGNRGPKPGAARDSGGGGLSGSGIDPLETERQQILARLEVIREGMLTEQEQLIEALAQKQMTIDEAFQKRLITEQQHNQMMEQVETEHQGKLAAIRQAGFNSALDGAAGVFRSLGRIVQSGGQKNVKMAKAFGIAEAIISTFVAANKAMAFAATAGPAAAFGAYAAVAAKGLAAVASIRSISDTGGGSGGGAGGGSFAAPATDSPGSGGGGNVAYLTLQGGDFYSREQIRDLVEKISEYTKDGGRLVLA
jgi:hypothetical protein